MVWGLWGLIGFGASDTSKPMNPAHTQSRTRVQHYFVATVMLLIFYGGTYGLARSSDISLSHNGIAILFCKT